MLWESDDPFQQLDRRFGFRGGAAAAAWVTDTLASSWDLEVSACERVVISSWNAMAWVVAGSRRLIAKWSAVPPRFSRLENSARLVDWLDRHGIPVAAPMPATDGRLLVEVANRAKGRVRSRLPLPGSRFLLGVLPVIEGDLLDVDDSTHVADAGRMLATLHEALAAYPDRDAWGRPAHQEQLVHNDFRAANILHDGTRVTAVLDFEEVTYAPRVADLAKAAVLLATRYRNWQPANPDVREAFVAAYNEHAETGLTTTERETFEALVAENLRQKWWVAD
jgi:homoserine kinase type II